MVQRVELSSPFPLEVISGHVLKAPDITTLVEAKQLLSLQVSAWAIALAFNSRIRRRGYKCPILHIVMQQILIWLFFVWKSFLVAAKTLLGCYQTFELFSSKGKGVVTSSLQIYSFIYFIACLSH